tara:strand:- start:567 stop:785 length:219 start_codon:yes stop_codon:yes gene_type:complete
MRNKPLPGLCKKSPLRQDVDTRWADKVFSGSKVDESLKKSGHHTAKGIRGQENTSTGMKNAGFNNAMIDMSI